VRNHKGFTILELLVLLAIIALVMTILMPSLSQTHERAKRTACAANLHGIVQALYLYAQNPPYLFPAVFKSYTASNNLHLFYPMDRTSSPSTTAVPSPTVDLWTLARRGLTVPKQFVCPSTRDVPDPMADPTAYYDFAVISNLSYGYQYQHDPNREALGTSTEPTFPLMADGNPYIKGGLPPSSFASDRIGRGRGNSLNHTNREGQNVLFVDGHVSFEEGPDVGLSGRVSSGLTISRGRDHCYTMHAPTFSATVDYGMAAPTWTSPYAAGSCDLGGKSDACLVP
jgi:prepilin-type processing-associated H-X9-DG protein